MFFLFRCVFWLSIVFYAMPWPQGPSPDGGKSGLKAVATSLAGDLAHTAGSAVKAKLDEACSKKPGDCVAVIAPLTQIVATGEAADAALPRRTVRLADNEAGHSSNGHKAPALHN